MASAIPFLSRHRRRTSPTRSSTDAAVKSVDMYFGQGGFHMNLNVIDKDTLEDAMKNRTNTRSSRSACPGMPSTLSA